MTALSFPWQQGGGQAGGVHEELTMPLTQSQTLAAFVQNQRDEMHAGVRRLTPRECERLQGFPDDYTLVPYRSKPAADGPRYKALGNSMAVPCMRWLVQRIELVQKLLEAACPPTYSAGPPDKLLEETV